MRMKRELVIYIFCRALFQVQITNCNWVVILGLLKLVKGHTENYSLFKVVSRKTKKDTKVTRRRLFFSCDVMCWEFVVSI